MMQLSPNGRQHRCISVRKRCYSKSHTLGIVQYYYTLYLCKFFSSHPCTKSQECDVCIWWCNKMVFRSLLSLFQRIHHDHWVVYTSPPYCTVGNYGPQGSVSVQYSHRANMKYNALCLLEIGHLQIS